MNVPAIFRPLGLLLFALLLTGCTTGPVVFQGLEGPPAGADPSASAPSASAGESQPATRPALSAEEFATNRLLAIGFDGNLFTVDGDGDNRLELTTDASSQRRYLQPTWSSSGEQIAYTRVEGSSQNFLVTVAADGTGARETELPFAPFFIFWSPSDQRLAYLSNWQPTATGQLALRLVDVAADKLTTRTLLQGSPLYFSWSPTGDRLLTHTRNREVALLSLDGEETGLVSGSGNFATPQWLPDGERLFYAVDDEAGQRMIITDLDGVETEAVTYFNGAAAFSVSPDGRRVAFVDTINPVGMNATGPLHLLDLEEGIFREVTDEPAVAFYWSPDGSALLYFTVTRINQRIWLQPFVWNGEKSIALDRFRPTATFFEQYLRFADQYAQSMTFWSPDSRQVVFSGWGQNNRAGLWVQPADGSAPATRVARGVYATWSPK